MLRSSATRREMVLVWSLKVWLMICTGAIDIQRMVAGFVLGMGRILSSGCSLGMQKHHICEEAGPMECHIAESVDE
jgi:hypothetical protein